MGRFNKGWTPRGEARQGGGGGTELAVHASDFFFRIPPLATCIYRHSEGNVMRRLPGVVTIAAVAVGIGLLPLPYGYYMLLRLFLCVLCIYFLSSVRGIRDGEKWVLCGLAVLYNPIVPVELEQAALEHHQHRNGHLVLCADQKIHVIQ